MIVDNGKYFLYRHTREDKNEPFYIGVGTKTNDPKKQTFNEIYRRAFLKAYRNPIWQNIVSKTKYQIEILIESDDYNFIEIKEIEYIKLYGRKDNKTGILANLTDGGRGQRNVFNRFHSEETKRKMSNSSIGKPKTESHKNSLSSAKLTNPVRFWKNKEFSENHKHKLSIAKLGKPSLLKGKTNPRISERFKQDFTVIKSDTKSNYFCSKTELRKLLGISLKTFNKLLDGQNLKQTKIKIYAITKIRQTSDGDSGEQ